MFSWICPRCGRENRASDNECAYCQAPEPAEVHREEEPLAESEVYAEPEAYAEPEPYVAPPPPPPPPMRATRPIARPGTQAVTPPPIAAVARPVASPPPPRRAAASAPPPSAAAYAPAAKPGLPVWILLPLFAFAFIGLGAALYFGYQRFTGTGKAGFTGGEVPVSASKAKGAANPTQKFLEVVGIRLTQDGKRKPQARFIAVNHGTTELDEATANVTLWASTSRSEEDSVGTFTFKVNGLGPNEAKEITVPLKTKLRVYELPDWQNLTAEVQIISQ